MSHPLSFRQYRLFWIARVCAMVAQNAMVVVIGWQVYETARRTMDVKQAALQLGFVGLAQFAPLLCLVLLTGWTADRVDRRFIAIGCIVLQLGCAATLAMANLQGPMTLAQLFAVAVALGVGRAFSMPANTALAPNLLPLHALPRAIAMNSIAGRLGAIFGPAAGGYLYAVAPSAPYLASVALFTVALVSLSLLRPVTVARLDGAGNPWRQMVQGLSYVWRHRLVLGAISLDLFAVLLGVATALLPAFASDVLHVGPTGLGNLRAAPAVGAMASALWFSFRPLRASIGTKMLVSVAVFGGATIVFGLSRSMALSLASLTVLGAADMLSVYVRQSLVQLSTPDSMRGRVGAVSSLFISASNELGEAESGFLAALVGPVGAVIGGGLGAVMVAALWARWFPELRQADRLEL
jgi:MFS family permease